MGSEDNCILMMIWGHHASPTTSQRERDQAMRSLVPKKKSGLLPSVALLLSFVQDSIFKLFTTSKDCVHFHTYFTFSPL
jgi:hypothetical protein